MEEAVKRILNNVKEGKIDVDEAVKQLKLYPFEDLGYAKIDHHRKVRQGVGEVIFAQNKTPYQIKGILESLTRNNAENIIITRLNEEAADY